VNDFARLASTTTRVASHWRPNRWVQNRSCNPRPLLLDNLHGEQACARSAIRLATQAWRDFAAMKASMYLRTHPGKNRQQNGYIISRLRVDRNDVTGLLTIFPWVYANTYSLSWSLSWQWGDSCITNEYFGKENNRSIAGQPCTTPPIFWTISPHWANISAKA